MSGPALFIIFYSLFMVLYFVTINGFYLFLILISFFGLRSFRFARKMVDPNLAFHSAFYKPLTIIIPAFNEEATIVETTRSALALRYPELEIIVVNDGSLDKTLGALRREFRLEPSARDHGTDLACSPIRGIYSSADYPNLVVVDKINGGKSDALNAGINVCRHPLFCNIDSDSLVDSEALLKVVDLFAHDWRIVAAGGTIRAANDCLIEEGRVVEVRLPRNFWARFQVVEYLRAFLFGRAGWSAMSGLLILSGAFSVFRRSAVVKAGGYRPDTVGEDMELVLRIQRVMKSVNREYRVVFLPDPVCWTQVPESLRGLSLQRRRWQRGLAESLVFNFSMFMNPQYGSAGMVSFPFFFFFEFLGPLVELSGYIVFIIGLALGLLNPPFALVFLTAAILLGVLLSTAALLMEELYYRSYPRLRDLLALFCFAFLENFFYRQFHSWWRFRGLLDFLFKKRTWGSPERQSFSGEE